MSTLELPQEPVRNSVWSLVPTNLPATYLAGLFGVFMTLLLLFAAQHYAAGSLFYNLILVSIFGMSAREQLTYPFAGCLPHFQRMLRRNLLLAGLAGNLLLMLIAVLFYRIPWQHKLDMAEAMLFGGLAVYLVLTRLLLSMKDLRSWGLSWASLILVMNIPKLGPSPREILDLALPLSVRLLLPLITVLAFAWFWRLLARPRYFRQVMDVPVPGGFDTSNSMEALVSQNEEMQRYTERRWQNTRIAHWVAGIRLPGYSCISDHLNVVLNRSLTLLLGPAFWIMVLALCVFIPNFASVRGARDLATLYPMLLMMYFVWSVESIGASPLLPYSRLERAVGLLAANMLALLLFLAFLLLTSHVASWLEMQIHVGTAVSSFITPRDMVLAILLTAPAVCLAHLLVSVLKGGAVFVFGISMVVCAILAMAVSGSIAASGRAGAGLNFWPWLAAGWGIHLFFVLVRFRWGSLEKR